MSTKPETIDDLLVDIRRWEKNACECKDLKTGEMEYQNIGARGLAVLLDSIAARLEIIKERVTYCAPANPSPGGGGANSGSSSHARRSESSLCDLRRRTPRVLSPSGATRKTPTSTRFLCGGTSTARIPDGLRMRRTTATVSSSSAAATAPSRSIALFRP